MNLKGKVVIITADNSGIGTAIILEITCKVVKRFPARVAAKATSNGCAFSSIKLRARSKTAKAA